MRLISTKTIHGQSIYHRRPLIVSKVDLGLLTDTPSTALPGFTDRLMAQLPTLIEHTCSPGHRGGFLERLKRGTYLAHIIEHIALELGDLAGIGVSYGKSVYAGQKGQYLVMTRFSNEEAMKQCHKSAFALAKALLANEAFDHEEEIRHIQRIASRTTLGPSGKSIFDAAQKRGIPVQRTGSDSLLRLGYGRGIRHVQTAVTDRTSHIAVELVQDKFRTKKVLEAGGVPVPGGRSIRVLDELNDVLEDFDFPLAVKPLDGNHGNGVCLNLKSAQEVQDAFHIAKEFSSRVLVEEMAFGKDYRVLVIGGKVSAAAERVPPFVTGDGDRSIEGLIERLNMDPRRADGHSGFLTKIEVDDLLLQTLQKSGYSLQSIPAKDERVFLRQNANLSGGGTATDVTDVMHPTVRQMCERIARLVNLDICGIDVIHPDITKPAKMGMKVIEVNAGPGLRMHLAPSEGQPRPVGQHIVDMMYPDPKSARIPILTVTGTNGKTSTARMLAHVMKADGLCVGMTSSDGIYIGDELLESGDTSGPLSTAKVLNDPKVECAVLELARGGLLRGGLAYDYSDVGIVTNIRPDHLGQDGLETLEDLVRVKSLLVEGVKRGGTVVLNAEDPMSLGLRTRPQLQDLGHKYILYSTRADDQAVLSHVEAGGDACWVENGLIVAMQSGVRVNVGAVSALPVTMGGAVRFQVSNVLAVIAGALAGGVGARTIFRALEEFDPGLQNQGRANLYRVGETHVILDYGHNTDAFKAMGEVLENFPEYRKIAIMGLPGDRDTKVLREAAQEAAKHFDHIIARDDKNRRGRHLGEIPALIRDAALEVRPYIEITLRENERQAVETALQNAGRNDLVVLFYDTLGPALESLRLFDPQPIRSIAKRVEELPLNGGGVPVSVSGMQPSLAMEKT